MDKQALRQELRRLGRALSPEARAEASRSICARLRTLISEIGPRHIALYMALPDEPDLTPLLPELATAHQLYLPRVIDDETMAFYRYRQGDPLEPTGHYRIAEPQPLERVAPSTLDLIVVPAMAYDAEGYRLGRGRGYYDRYLSSTRAYTVGVSLGLLPIASLPRSPWDIPMDQVILP